jgi:hypothetical protein
MHPHPDYAKQFEAADLVAIVRVREVADTGATNRLDPNSQIRFREFETDMEVLSLLKGEATNAIKCRLFRFPSEQERNADLGERDARIQYLKATPWESGLFVPKQHHEYLVYLKRSEAGYYLPARGVQTAVYSFLELKVPCAIDPDRKAKQTRCSEPGDSAPACSRGSLAPNH